MFRLRTRNVNVFVFSQKRTKADERVYCVFQSSELKSKQELFNLNEQQIFAYNLIVYNSLSIIN